MLFVSRLPLLYCLDVPYSLLATGEVRVDLSDLLRVMIPCVICHFPILCPLSEVILIVLIPDLCCLLYNR